MNPIPHPAVFLPAGVAASLRTSAAAAEEQRDLTPAQLDTIYGEQWFRFFVPAMYGGQPLSLPDAVRLEEAISWADGSAGWTVTLCAGAGWFTGFFPLSATGSSPSALTSFFSDRQLCLAGSGAPSGRADQLPEGYRVSGRWQYASGALHATGFTANCVIHSEGRPVLNEDGTPQIRAFLFKKEEVFVHRDWDTIGLIATASHAFEVRDRIVPADRCFRIAPENAAIDEPLYGYPFLQLAEVTLAACLSGMAMHFVDCCERLFAGGRNKRCKPWHYRRFERALRRITQGRPCRTAAACAPVAEMGP